MIIHETQIEHWIEEDFPGFDLTSHLLDMRNNEAQLTLKSRDTISLSGCNEAVAVLKKLGAVIEFSRQEGERIDVGDTILVARADASQLHAAWRISMNLLEYASGIATRTYDLVQAVMPFGRPSVCGTRKAFPGGRRLTLQALISGGGIPHRLGLGETILVFANHYRLHGFDYFINQQLPELKISAREKKIAVEVETVEQALVLAENKVDLIQLDKLSIQTFTQVRQQIRELSPMTQVITTGGITPDSAVAYAQAGADILATSWMYYGKPADIEAKITLSESNLLVLD